jgi:hypothetical protein
MKYVWIAGAVIVAIILVVVIIGYTLPVKHRSSGRVSLNAPPDRVFDLLTRVEDFPSWRSGVKVEMLPPVEGKLRYREESSDGTITFVREREERNAALVTRIDDKSLPFGGTWTYQLVPESPTRTTLIITEDGEVYNPVFRFVSRFVMGHDGTIRKFLGAVERKLGS